MVKPYAKSTITKKYRGTHIPSDVISTVRGYLNVCATALSNPGHNVTTNYTYYSVLVYYDDGRVELVEGDSKEIETYLSYMKSPTDRLREALIKSTEKGSGA